MMVLLMVVLNPSAEVLIINSYELFVNPDKKLICFYYPTFGFNLIYPTLISKSEPAAHEAVLLKKPSDECVHLLKHFLILCSAKNL